MNEIVWKQNEMEALLILQEECSEVAQAVSKCFRFGKDGEWDGTTNGRRLEAEIGDVLALIDILVERGFISDSNIHGVNNDISLMEGENITNILYELLYDIEHCDRIVFTNYLLNKEILENDLNQNSFIYSFFSNKIFYCLETYLKYSHKRNKIFHSKVNKKEYRYLTNQEILNIYNLPFNEMDYYYLFNIYEIDFKNILYGFVENYFNLTEQHKRIIYLPINTNINLAYFPFLTGKSAITG